MSFALLLLAACSGPDDDTPAAETDTDTAPPADTDTTPALVVDLDETGAAVQRAVDLLAQMSAQPLVDAYTYLMQDVETTCPNYEEVEGGNHFWDGACTTSTGAYYHGAAFYYRLTETELTGLDLGGLSGVIPMDMYNTGTKVTGEGFFGQIDSANTAGEAFRCSCRGVSLAGVTAANELLWFNHTYGPISWDGPNAATTWLGTDQRAHLSQLARYVPATGRKARNVSGILNGMPSPYTTVELALSFDVTRADQCMREPIGTLNVRDRVTGYWIDVVLDVDASTSATDATCDGCGAASLNGEPLGTVCADFSSLYTFTNGPPWG